jgi:hypothetical protein
MRNDNSEIAESVRMSNDYWEDLDKMKKDRLFTKEADLKFKAKRE